MTVKEFSGRQKTGQLAHYALTTLLHTAARLADCVEGRSVILHFRAPYDQSCPAETRLSSYPWPYPRSRLAGDDHVPAVAGPTSAFTPVGGVGGGGRLASTSPPPCERCLLLSETLEDLRERARMQQRLLEHSDKLLVVATQRPDGRLQAATPTSAATVPVEAHGAPPTGDGTPTTNANRDGGGQGTHHPGASVHTGTPAETKGGAAPAALAGEEDEELLAAAEAVWRISELARSALEEELDKRENALAAAARAAQESKEALSEQVGDAASRTCCALGHHKLG